MPLSALFSFFSALLAEGMHSAADVANQVLLKLGVIRSRRKPNAQHQYGFHKEKYVYALISAACVFCVGCGASVVHGVTSWFDPHPLAQMGLSLSVLLASSVAEGYSLWVAYRMIKHNADEQGTDVWQYIQRGRDPTTAAILWEDGGAVAGLCIAMGFTALTWVTGQPHWDAMGSIAVGLLMGVIALQLMRTNKKFLIGQAMEPETQQKIVDHLEQDSMVLKVVDPKSEEMGDGVYRFKAEIQWSGEHVVQKYLATRGRETLYRQLRAAACGSVPINAGPVEAGAAASDLLVRQDAIDYAMMDFGKGVIRTVGTEIDRLEGELRTLVPGLRYVDLETDKGAAARGTDGSVMGSMDGGGEAAAAAAIEAMQLAGVVGEPSSAPLWQMPAQPKQALAPSALDRSVVRELYQGAAGDRQEMAGDLGGDAFGGDEGGSGTKPSG